LRVAPGFPRHDHERIVVEVLHQSAQVFAEDGLEHDAEGEFAQ
jgi:hypothetical protein